MNIVGRQGGAAESKVKPSDTEVLAVLVVVVRKTERILFACEK